MTSMTPPIRRRCRDDSCRTHVGVPHWSHRSAHSADGATGTMSIQSAAAAEPPERHRSRPTAAGDDDGGSDVGDDCNGGWAARRSRSRTHRPAGSGFSSPPVRLGRPSSGRRCRWHWGPQRTQPSGVGRSCVCWGCIIRAPRVFNWNIIVRLRRLKPK